MKEFEDNAKYKMLCDSLHQEALAKEREQYIDPKTGAIVFTELFHLKRGTCCGSKCRHCPYDHENVPRRS
ncbi:MAG: hypothetical protein KDD70_14305 [Bdellovibrionales bacterium]|nr:hypothetical protein [Bdellovibrionales bacterium]